MRWRSHHNIDSFSCPSSASWGSFDVWVFNKFESIFLNYFEIDSKFNLPFLFENDLWYGYRGLDNLSENPNLNFFLWFWVSSLVQYLPEFIHFLMLLSSNFIKIYFFKYRLLLLSYYYIPRLIVLLLFWDYRHIFLRYKWSFWNL